MTSRCSRIRQAPYIYIYIDETAHLQYDVGEGDPHSPLVLSAYPYEKKLTGDRLARATSYPRSITDSISHTVMFYHSQLWISLITSLTLKIL